MILSISVAKSKSAFTLIELMAAVVIVSILVTLAVPRFRVFIAKARQGEAHINLDIIAKLQQSYFNEHNVYNSDLAIGKGKASGTCPTSTDNANILGFRTADCEKLRYNYTTSGATTAGGNSAGGGIAENDGSVTSLLIYPGCSSKTDLWDINDKRDLTNRTKVIEACKE